MKALYIIVNADFVEEIIEFVRLKGATGATVINARGISLLKKEIMGISADMEKEIVLTLTDDETAERIMEDIKEKSGFRTGAHGICFALSVTKAIGVREQL